jgi:glutaminyl-tRNA synthetase
VGKEVRLKGAYFVTCTDFVKDEQGTVTEVHCEFDPETRSGSGFDGRKVKGTIHWVSAATAENAEVRLYDYLVLDDPNAESGVRENPDSITVKQAKLEPSAVKSATEGKVQFIRNGYYCLDSKDSTDKKPVFNRICSLKSSYRVENL